MSDLVINDNEVILYGTRFATFGAIRRTAVTPFPPKVTIGDYSRDDKIVTSSWVLSDFSGGAGILHSRFPTDADRFWYSTLETRYRHLTLPPEIHKAGTLDAAADLITSYNERMYIVVGSNVYIWSEASKDWTLIHTLDSAGVGLEVFGGYLYILTSAGLNRFNDFDQTWGSFPGHGGFALIEWDGKLFRLGLDNHMYWTNADPTIWDELGILHLPAGYCRQLITYFDQTGEMVIHAITRVGLYGYDFGSGKFYQTPLKFPVTQSAGKGAMVWRGELYIPAGQTAYKYNGASIQVVSPNKDDGLPPHLRGDVQEMIPGHAFFHAVISTHMEGSAGAAVDAPMFTTGNWLEGNVMHAGQVTGAIMSSAQASWHGLYDANAGTRMGAAYVGAAEGTFRLWITSDAGIYYIDAPTGLHNPLQNPTTQYRQSGFLETGWTDLGWAEMDKLALSMDVRGENCTRDDVIHVYAAWDNNDEWQHVGTVTSDEPHQFYFQDEEGHVFRSMRIRLEMERGSESRHTPVLRSAIVSFMRRPAYLWGFTFNLDLSTGHAGLSAEQLIDRLYNLMEVEKKAGRFVYRDEEINQLRNFRVAISNIEGAELGGMTSRGRYTVSLLQLDEVEEDPYVRR